MKSHAWTAVGHGVLWFGSVSVTAALVTSRSGVEAVSVGALSAVLYAGVVYLWDPY